MLISLLRYFLVSAADGWFESSVLSSTYVFVWNRRICVKVNFGDDMVGTLVKVCQMMVLDLIPSEGGPQALFIDERAQHKSRRRPRGITAHPCEVELWQGEMWLSRQHDASKFHFLTFLLFALGLLLTFHESQPCFSKKQIFEKVAVAVPKQPRVTEYPLSW